MDNIAVNNKALLSMKDLNDIFKKMKTISYVMSITQFKHYILKEIITKQDFFPLLIVVYECSWITHE